MTEKVNSIKDKIINEIKSGKIKMRPKIYFWVKLVFFVFLIAILFLLTIFLVSFIRPGAIFANLAKTVQ
jgi:hypothetical protein